MEECLPIKAIIKNNLQSFSPLTYITSFFNQPSHPVNLAIFRIVLFSLILTQVNLEQLLWLSSIPKELVFPPRMLDWFLNFLKIDESWIRISYWIFLVTCILSILGLFTRFSIFVTTVLAFYLLGVPNFFGKVNHTDHHLVLFATIMIVSRCSDVWSIDALLRSRKSDFTPNPSIVYGLPVRIIWLIFGVQYFFAGFWKAYAGGWAWVFSDNLKYVMYEYWYLLDWIPSFRLDNYPLLFKTSALLTILFEVSFIFFLFLGRLRYVVIIGGLIFHFFTYVFLKISFVSLQICYVIFFDFAFLYNWYDRKILKKNYSITPGLPNETKQIPYMTVMVGGLLILGNIYAGFRNNMDSWYFSCYPTFQDVIVEPETTILSIQTDFGDGKYKEIDRDTIKKISDKYHYARFMYTTYRIANNKNDRLFKAFWNLIKNVNPALEKATTVRIYEYLVSTVPNEKFDPPIAEKLLFEYNNSDNSTTDTNR